MPVDIAEFRKYLLIDKKRLDDAVTQQPSLFFEISEALAEAIAARDLAKEQLANVDADLDKDIRLQLETAGKRATETIVASMVQADPEHQNSFNTYVDVKKKADILMALKDAFQQRGYMLRDLCQLYVANYFEDDSIKANSNTDRVAYEEKRKLLRDARSRRARTE